MLKSGKLKPFQLEAVDFAVKVKTAAIFAKQRAGKTWIALGIIDRLRPKRTLILCPLTNKESTWVKNLKEQIGDVVITTDPGNVTRHDARNIVLVLHLDALGALVKRLKRMRFDLVIVDESHRIKSRASKVSRACYQIGKEPEYKVLLTATPVEQAPQDLWAQFRFLNVDVFGSRWKAFDTDYLEPCGWMNKKRRFRKDRLPVFMDKIKPFCTEISEEDAGIVPASVSYIGVHMLGSQRILYDTLERDSMATLTDGSEVESELQITLVNKLHQVCGGMLLTGDDEEAHLVGRAKERKLKVLMGRDKGPFVVFFRYKAEIIRLQSLLQEKYSVAILWGALKDKPGRPLRTNLLAAFQRGEFDVLLAQIRTGGVGVDLFTAHTAYIYSTTYSYIDFDQAIKRLNSQHKTEAAQIKCLYCLDTLEEDIYDLLKDKRKVSAKILLKIRRRKKISIDKQRNLS